MASTSESAARLVGRATAVPPALVIARTVASMVPGIGTGSASVARAAHTTARAGGGELDRGRGAHAAARARDDRDRAGELHGAGQ